MTSPDPWPYFDRNPFLHGYMLDELAFYGSPPEAQVGVARYCYITHPAGVLDDYLNDNWRIESPPTPALFVDDQLQMSLAWMECQSMAPAIALARGVVGLGGLGLGYTALRAAAKPEVEHVVVAEIHPDVIALFRQLHADRPELAKIEVVHGDALEVLTRAPHLDLLFLDIYPTLLPDRVIDDLRRVRAEAHADRVLFWGYERVMLDAMLAFEPVGNVEPWLNEYLWSCWQFTPALEGSEAEVSMGDWDEDEEGQGRLLGFYQPLTDPAYRQAVLEALSIL